MGRFGSITAHFFDRTNLSTPVMDSAGVYTRVPIIGDTAMEKSAEGRGEVLFAFDDLLWELAQVGRVMTLFQTDAVTLSVDVPPYPAVPFGLPIVIETVELVEPGQVRVEGPDLLTWLKDVQVFRPIGAGVVTNSTVTAKSLMMKLAADAGSGATMIKPSSINGWAVGDEARIERNGGAGTHVTTVSAINDAEAPSNPNTLVLSAALPSAADAGNDLERRRYEGVNDPAVMTLAAAAGVGTDIIKPSSMVGWEVGDEARIELDGGLGTHVTVVTTINDADADDNPNTFVVRETLPVAAAAGNDLERRRRRVQVAAGHGASFAVGVECRLTMDNNSVHETLVDEAPDGDVITMQAGAPDGAAVGKAVTATNYANPTTSDVNSILGYVGWSANYESGGYTGTANGTHHAPKGDSVYDLLTATAARSGEFFRLREVVINPVKQIMWRRTADYAGHNGNLRLVMPDDDDVDNEAANINRGIITGGVRRVGRFVPVTRVIPYAGDDRISLKLCSNGARALAASAGVTVVDTGLGLYTPPYVRSASAETTWGVISRVVTFSDIRAETDNTAEWRTVADSLLMATLHYMKRHGTAARYQYEVENVVCPLLILPGQRVEMVYNDPAGKWSVNKTGVNSLYVESVRRHFDPVADDGQTTAGGVFLTSLTLVETPGEIPDVVTSAAEYINSIAKLARAPKPAAPTGRSGGTTTVVTGGSASDHGSLTGLADDDHPHYLRADGTRTLLGNLSAADGVTFDGVDLSAHAADPNAHHPAVIPANTGVFVAGQAVGVNLASPSALEINAGLKLAATVAGNGLQLATQVLSVRLSAASGMLFASGALALGTPGALSAASANAVTATSHTHAVAASSNPGAATQLLKTDTSGFLQILALGIGVAPDGVNALKITPPGATWGGLLLKQRSDQIAPLLRIENAAGGALLILTAAGDLESGSPGFVSGLTGWQIAAPGNVEFNNGRFRGEFHATTFVADEMHATGGTLLVASATTVAEPSGSYNNTMKAVDTTTTTYLVVTASWATGLCYFGSKDVVRIKSQGEIAGGGSLYIPDIYLEVSSVINLNDRNLAQGNPGHHVLVCVRKSGGYTGYVVPTGSSVAKWTKTGQGVGAYKGGMTITADLPQSPYLDVFTVDASLASLAPWPGSGDLRTPPTIKPRVRLGNLDGVLGLSEQWGIAAGTDLSDTSTAARCIVASDLGVTLRNVDLSIYSGAERVIRLYTGGLTLLNGTTTFPAERSIRWMKANGANVAALAVRGDTLYHLSLGLRPTFADVLAATGIDIYEDDTASGGDRIDLKASEVSVLGNLYVAENMSAASFQTNGTLKTGAGIVVGDTAPTPGNAAILFKEKTFAAGVPPAGMGHFWLQNVAGVQKFYVRFANGVIRELASAA